MDVMEVGMYSPACVALLDCNVHVVFTQVLFRYADLIRCEDVLFSTLLTCCY